MVLVVTDVRVLTCLTDVLDTLPGDLFFVNLLPLQYDTVVGECALRVVVVMRRSGNKKV